MPQPQPQPPQTDGRSRGRRAAVVAVLALVAASGLAAAGFRASASPEPLRVTTADLPARDIRVQVSGEVLQPGVYQLQPGDRVIDAIAAAGGPTTRADLDRLSLAARARDEDRIVVPPTGERPTGAADDRVILNTATQQEFERLPGIGPVTAERIVQSRQQDGPFRSVDDLRTRRLIGQATLDRIRASLLVD